MSVQVEANGKADAEAVDESVRVPGTAGRLLSSMLPYVLLVGLVLAIPRSVCRPSPEGANYHLAVLVYVGINTILAVGLNLLMGYAGQVSLGHAAFYGMGAYVSAVLTAQGFPSETVRPAAAVVGCMVGCAAAMSLLRAEAWRVGVCLGGMIPAAFLMARMGPASWVPWAVTAGGCLVCSLIVRRPVLKVGVCWAVGLAAGMAAAWLLSRSASGGVSPWLAMAAGVVFVSTAAYLVGGQALRLHGYYLAMATLGFGVIVSIVFLQWEPVTGGTSGIYGIPSLQAFGLSFDRDITMYYLVWSVVVALVAAANNIVNSRVGRAFRAVHGSEVAAATLGVDTTKYKVQVFILSAALASLAGSLYAHYVTFISPEPFGFKFSVELVVMVVVGGMASVWGAIFGAGTVTVLGELLRGLGHGEVRGLGVPLSDFDVVVFGLILMLIMVYMPAGLVRGVMDSIRFAGAVARRGRGRQD